MGERLHNKIGLLMGGGSSAAEGGLSNGQAVALTFAREGAKLAVVDQHLQAAAETVRLIEAAGGQAIALQADVSRHDQVRGGVLDSSEESWDHVHDVNLKSVFLACKAVIPLMQAQGGGAIVNVSSVAS